MLAERTLEPFTPAPAATHKVRFDGNGTEYFRIWIVNTVLTILTLGLFWPWAKIRARRYFYGNTTLDGDPFDFLAEPMPILRGFLIIGVGFLLYNIANQIAPLVALGILGFFFLIWPWLFYKAVRFRSRYSAWRAVRFGFDGSLGRSYLVNLFMYLLVPVTLGLILPQIRKMRQEYVWDNLRIGQQRFSVELESSRFYAAYIIGGFVMGFFIFCFSMLAGLIAAATFGSGNHALIYLIPILSYIPIFLIYIAGQSYIYTEIFRHTMDNLSLGAGRFHSSLQWTSLAWVQISNLLLTIFTLGLFFPWAQVRRARCILTSITVFAPTGALESFHSAPTESASAVGDVASDVFDFEIGL